MGDQSWLLSAICSGASGAVCALAAKLVEPQVPCACHCECYQPENQLQVRISLAITCGLAFFIFGLLCGSLCCGRSSVRHHLVEARPRGKGVWGGLPQLST